MGMDASCNEDELGKIGGVASLDSYAGINQIRFNGICIHIQSQPGKTGTPSS